MENPCRPLTKAIYSLNRELDAQKKRIFSLLYRIECLEKTQKEKDINCSVNREKDAVYAFAQILTDFADSLKKLEEQITSKTLQESREDNKEKPKKLKVKIAREKSFVLPKPEPEKDINYIPDIPDTADEMRENRENSDGFDYEKAQKISEKPFEKDHSEEYVPIKRLYAASSKLKKISLKGINE